MKEIRTSSDIALEGLILTMDTLNGSRAHCYLDDMQRGFTNEHSPIHTPQVGEADLRRKEDLGMDKDKAACRPSIDRKCAVDLDK